ncbi:hypothetical protein [Providencia rettgeri]|uniref:hypothetical protein n=1 Tax=Providencia rettgeri TaxID=587 RepID=UPI0012BBABD5
MMNRSLTNIPMMIIGGLFFLSSFLVSAEEIRDPFAPLTPPLAVENQPTSKMTIAPITPSKTPQTEKYLNWSQSMSKRFVSY